MEVQELQTAALAFGGRLSDSLTNIQNATEEYDGSSWTSSGNLNTARFQLGGTGTQTAAISFWWSSCYNS
jgi:hypothetical protein